MILQRHAWWTGGWTVVRPQGGTPVPITLVLNPRDDPPFVGLAEAIVTEGIGAPAELQTRLRQAYPNAIVRARELDGEAQSIWYVYRDGHWIPAERGGARETDGG
jgi:hypothetical protein